MRSVRKRRTIQLKSERLLCQQIWGSYKGRRRGCCVCARYVLPVPGNQPPRETDDLAVRTSSIAMRLGNPCLFTNAPPPLHACDPRSASASSSSFSAAIANAVTQLTCSPWNECHAWRHLRRLCITWGDDGSETRSKQWHTEYIRTCVFVINSRFNTRSTRIWCVWRLEGPSFLLVTLAKF